MGCQTLRIWLKSHLFQRHNIYIFKWLRMISLNIRKVDVCNGEGIQHLDYYYSLQQNEKELSVTLIYISEQNGEVNNYASIKGEFIYQWIWIQFGKSKQWSRYQPLNVGKYKVKINSFGYKGIQMQESSIEYQNGDQIDQSCIGIQLICQ
ncbi:unnamed protein product [Paramecium octaurelia]|uniref:Uncharacterized protein n=1 Tax=Paramecium octaurelia TaxID=43137 RepID=A0A8S1Y178_PAROT|nr:unnamed protein product [Paramecium octaurelia]